MRAVFLSYRRDDTQTVTGFIYSHLTAPTGFGPDGVFMDIDDIPPGVDFREVIDDTVGACRFFLAVIGPRWVTPRLQHPGDFVRLEIEAAIKRGIPLVPVLVDGATMPKPDELPNSLQPLLFMNATTIRPGRQFASDIEQLVKGLHRAEEWKKRKMASAVPTRPTLIVCAAGTGQHRDIADAVKAAAPGTLIQVKPGTYRKSVVIDKNVELVADGPRDQVVIEVADEDCIFLKSDTATVRGFTIRQTGGFDERMVFAVYIPEGQPILEDCDITSSSLFCLAVDGSGVNLTVRNCLLRDGRRSGVMVYGRGAGVFEGCEIRGNGKCGVEARGHLTLHRCTITQNTCQAVLVHENGRATVENCDLRGNKGGAWEIHPTAVVVKHNNQE